MVLLRLGQLMSRIVAANTSGVCPECGTPVPPKPEAIA
jgi:hypothetical protein